RAQSPTEFRPAFAAMATSRVDSVVVTQDGEFAASFPEIAALSLANKLPSIGAREYAEAGGLIGYGVDILGLYRRAAYFVDRIFKGAKPADLPIDSQHVFHSGYERAVGLRRDDPVLAAMGLKSVFLSARPIVLSLARSTMPSSTTLFSNNRKVQRARPLGGLEQAKAISLASFSPSKIRATAGVARCLRVNTASKPSSTSCLRTR